MGRPYYWAYAYEHKYSNKVYVGSSKEPPCFHLHHYKNTANSSKDLGKDMRPFLDHLVDRSILDYDIILLGHDQDPDFIKMVEHDNILNYRGTGRNLLECPDGLNEKLNTTVFTEAHRKKIGDGNTRRAKKK